MSSNTNDIRYKIINGFRSEAIDDMLDGWTEGVWLDEHDAICAAEGIDAEADDTIQCYSHPDYDYHALVWWCGSDAWTCAKTL